ncbi:hypothetical protein GCM10008902_27010 [[Clostridium] innocuum]
MLYTENICLSSKVIYETSKVVKYSSKRVAIPLFFMIYFFMIGKYWI